MNLIDESTIVDVCKDIDIIVHAATYDERKIAKNPKEAVLVNAYGTKLLINDALNCGVKKFIYLSTFHVYGKSNGYINEDTQTIPLGDYGMTHLFAELYCKQYAEQKKMSFIITRSTNGIGVPASNDIDKWYLVLNDFCKSAFEQQKITLKTDGMQYRDFISITDVASGIETLIKDNPSVNNCEIYNISSQVIVTIRELVGIVADAYLKRYGKNVTIVIPETGEVNMGERLFIDSSKLRKLGWSSSVSIVETIEDIFNLLERNMVK
jgi:UDP-glucose 4-epimerase